MLVFALEATSAMAQKGGGGVGGGGTPKPTNPLVGKWISFIPGTNFEYDFTFTATFHFTLVETDRSTGLSHALQGSYSLVTPFPASLSRPDDDLPREGRH